MSTTFRATDRFFPIAYDETEAVLFRFFDALRHLFEEWEPVFERGEEDF